jgi:hypothetical protein
MILSVDDAPPTHWKVAEERFASLPIALETIRQLENIVGPHYYAFRWRGVSGSIAVIGEFWFP